MNYTLIGLIYSVIYIVNLRVVWENLKYHYKHYEIVKLGDVLWELACNLNPFRLFTTFGFVIDFIARKFDWVLNIKLLEKRKETK